ncbi:hypothetical protein [Domibacillus epiphyticus]|uniref:Uncharacterized protein n=1 Tax=Domibacillus epiphyticus TaxID=1714355 RepID=A0A1V2A7C6_9BACI|nr:hypothetical protein [Domibacillus epiphyticus]OMP66905.1 hypothetical protein BTO28_09850 [Domibacillus epiphyticus]
MEIKSIGAAVSSLTGMRLRIVHSILHHIHARDLITLKAKSRFSKDEMTPFFQAIVKEAEKQNELPNSELQLDVFIALSKLLKLPAARLNEMERVASRSDEIVNKWFEKAVKKDKYLFERWENSLLSNKLEFLLHNENVQRIERLLKNEKADEGKEPLLFIIQRYWEEMPEYKRVQIFEHLQVNREASFKGIVEEKGLDSFLFEMGTRMGLSMYENVVLRSIGNNVPDTYPGYIWTLHPNSLFTADVALKSLVSGSWLVPAAMMLMYMPTEDEVKDTNPAIIPKEWMKREGNYRELIRQINEVKLDQKEEEKNIHLIRQDLENALSAEERARSVYRNLRDRLIAFLKTDSARPYLGDISVSNTRIREKLLRIQSKMEANQSKKGLLKSTGAWLTNTYLQTERNSLEKKLQISFEKMADAVMEKYPYYEADLISEMQAAYSTANGWQFEIERLKKKEAEMVISLSEMKSKELKLRQEAAESASRTPGLKQLCTDNVPEKSPIA